MGYMGFGMQSWVYNKRPRRVFSKHEKIKSFTAIPKYSRDFKIQPSSDKSNNIGFILMLALIASLVIQAPKLMTYEKTRVENISLRNDMQNEMAFKFLVKSGKARLLRGHIEDAYSDLNLAYNLNPSDPMVNNLLIETLSILCEKDNAYCIKLDSLLMHSIET